MEEAQLAEAAVEGRRMDAELKGGQVGPTDEVPVEDERVEFKRPPSRAADGNLNRGFK
jgi:hypothetical protein